jgi:small subunit ribosomal protein S17e
MGRIKTQLVKRITNDLVKDHGDELKKDFNENKKKVEEFTTVKSKKIRNVIAGYVTRQVKQNE